MNARSIAGTPTTGDEVQHHIGQANQANQAGQDARAKADAIRNQTAGQQPQGGQR